MKQAGRRYGWLLLCVLAACSSGPRLNTQGVTPHITPPLAASTPDAVRDSKILWGGVIVNSVNERDITLLEVLAYPLRNNNRPDTGATPLGRFLIEYRGYLETADYTPGRVLTAVGRLHGLRNGRIGAADYRYPVVTEPQLHLWPVDTNSGSLDPQFHIGVGVIFH